jgi:hypothetical protein
MYNDINYILNPEMYHIWFETVKLQINRDELHNNTEIVFSPKLKECAKIRVDINKLTRIYDQIPLGEIN